MSTPRVATGLDVLVAEGFDSLRGRTVGVIANPTSVDARLRHLADLLNAAPELSLAALFGPEHGVRADAQDMIGVDSAVDSRTGVPVHSLYGTDLASLSPAPRQLDGLDTLVFDVQDVGSRYYTFAATMLYAMEAAAGRGIEFVVLDRPNPIGGVLVEGPTIQAGFHSFVGPHPMPNRHGMTVGELAGMFKAERSIDVNLRVVPCRGWAREMSWDETGLPWVMPSPNMPTPETALIYPGGCLIEGTNLSEGRGTTRPFELWGAPWIDPYVPLDGPPPEGVLLRPCAFRPMFHKHAAQGCRGLQPHVTDPSTFRPLMLYTRLLAWARAQDPGRFAWRTEVYEFVTDPVAIDLLYGSSRERKFIESGSSEWSDLQALWAADEAEFLGRRAEFLLYPADTTRTQVLMSDREPLLRIEGAVDRPLALTWNDLRGMPAADQVEDLARFNPKRPGDGVTLESLLGLCGVRPEANYLTLHADEDDFHVSVPLDAVRGQGIVVYRRGEDPLSEDRGGPIRFLIPDPAACHTAELDDCANVKYLSRIELSVDKGRDNRPAGDAEHEALHAREPKA
ncbi:DUF1343 domain-containing protein [Isosphaeraceae bacterium EP7]